MVYLGIPVGDKKLGKGAFVGVTEKIFKMIPPWKEKLMSDWYFLTAVYLVSLHIPWVFYLLPKGTHKTMDGIRSKFY
jgi:hypothetical protein